MKIDGYKELMSKFENLEKFTEKGIEKGLQKGSLRVVADAAMKLNSSTDGKGILAAHISAEVEKTKSRVGTNTKYAPYVEMGTGLFAVNDDGRKDVPWHYKDAEGKWHTTSGQHPKPFLQPALDANRNVIPKDVREGVRKTLKELCKK